MVDVHHPISRLVVLENTHNRCGGVPLTVAYTQSVGELAHQCGLRLHLDGARIFNAAVVQQVKASELAAPADSVTFCLSKGLCAPVGSVLCGTWTFIDQARRIRKQLGGGMRQAGVLAAAGIVALQTMIDRLADDHQRAKTLAQGLAQLPGLILDPVVPHTNMIFLTLSPNVPRSAQQIAEALLNFGIKIVSSGPRSIRLVTHYWIDDQAVQLTIEAFGKVLQ